MKNKYETYIITYGCQRNGFIYGIKRFNYITIHIT